MVPSPLTRAVDELKRAAYLDNADLLGDGELLDRFLARQDESAFEILVRRHGPMVLGVCRRILGNVPDVDDAFQATFVVLLKKGASIRPREQVGAWLHGVARRVACKAKGLVARQHQREQPMVDWGVESTPAFDHRDWLPLLDKELDRLPEKYRAAVVLCDLQGQSRREAATRLRVSEGTLSSRLARARALLGSRLKLRGVALSTALLAFSESAAHAAPPALVSATQTTIAAAASNGAVASTVTVLSQGVIKAMFVAKIIKGVAIALTIAALSLGAGTGYFLHEAYADKPAKPAADPTKPAKPAADPLKPAKPAAEGDKTVKPMAGDVLSGDVVSIDLSKKTLTMTVPVPGSKERKEESFPLGNDVKVLLYHGAKKESKEGKIEDVAAGDSISAQLTADKKAIAQIDVRPGHLQGTLKAVDTTKNSITVLTHDKSKEKQQVEKTVALDGEAKILLDNGLGTKTEPVPAKEGKLSDLTEGLVINIQLSGYDRTKGVSVHASGPSMQGTVKSVDAVNNTITISMKGEEEKTLPVSKDVKINGKGKLADVTAGAGASLRLSVEDKKTVVMIFVKE